MRYVTVPDVPRPVSRLTLGSAVFPSLEQAEVNDLLDAWVEGGGTMIDTARIYGGGESDRKLGEWLGAGNRERLMVLGKGCHPDADGSRMTVADLQSDITESLKALQTDHIELYMLHRDDPAVPAGEIVDWLHEQRQAGAIGAFGGSNWSVARVREANAHAEKRGIAGFAATSNYFGLATANEDFWPAVVLIGNEERDWYAETGTVNFAWSSLGRGYFAGKADGPDADANVARVYANEVNAARKVRAEELGTRRGLTGIQIAGAYAVNQPFPAVALVGAESAAEARAAAAAGDIELTAAEIRWLETDQ